MPSPKAAWGIEIGAYAIKAIRLERDGNDVRVSDFAVIPHKKVLTTPDLDQDEMVRLGLGQFISQKSLEGEHLVMSVPGHAAFARFAKLPPVEPKKVPDIVKFEAVQRLPQMTRRRLRWASSPSRASACSSASGCTRSSA
jgi:type IV pilus assembly protein PilM